LKQSKRSNNKGDSTHIFLSKIVVHSTDACYSIPRDSCSCIIVCGRPSAPCRELEASPPSNTLSSPNGTPRPPTSIDELVAMPCNGRIISISCSMGCVASAGVNGAVSRGGEMLPRLSPPNGELLPDGKCDAEEGEYSIPPVEYDRPMLMSEDAEKSDEES